MPAGLSPTAVAHRVASECDRSTSADDLFDRVERVLADAVPHDGSTWFGVDPATLLATAPARIDVHDAGTCDAFWTREFFEQDAGLWVDLARSEVPASGLRASLEDRAARSVRFRQFMQPQGYDDELRAVFRTGDRAWGLIALYREQGKPAFGEAEIRLVSAISAPVASALRRHATTYAGWDGNATASPGLLVFASDGSLLSANDQAAAWLNELYGVELDAHRWLEVPSSPEAARVATPIHSLIARARAVADGYDRTPARLRVRDQRGRWLLLHASCLRTRGDGTGGEIAVVIEPAKSAEVAPIIIEAYALTPRERDVVSAIARGLSTAEIAAALFLSQHTVKDHVKAVFEKVGVSSRGELVAKLFAEHYSEPLHAALH